MILSGIECLALIVLLEPYDARTMFDTGVQ